MREHDIVSGTIARLKGGRTDLYRPRVKERAPLLGLEDWQGVLNEEPGRRKVWGDDSELCRACGLEPFDWLLEILAERRRLMVMAGGWRVGKSNTGGLKLARSGLEKGGHYWIVAKDYSLTHPEYEYAAGFIQKLGETPIISMPMTGPWMLKVERDGNPRWLLIETKSADDPQKLEAANLDGVVLAEAAQLNGAIAQRCMGRLLQKQGWLFASGSFEQNEATTWFRDTYRMGMTVNDDGWKTFCIPSWKNTVVFPGGEEDPKILGIKTQLPDAVFEEKVGAKPQLPVDVVFGEFDPTIHIKKSFPPNHLERVAGTNLEIAVDFGYGAHYAVYAIVEELGKVWVIDEFYRTGMVTQQVVADLKERWWWKYVKGGVMDVAGKQHHGDRSQFELWRDLTGLYLRSRRIIPVYGIERLHTFLIDPAAGQPRLFLTETCRNLVLEFLRYRWRMVDGVKVGREPVDMYNHGIKAIWYYLIDRFGYVENQVRAEVEYHRSPYNWKRKGGETSRRGVTVGAHG